MLKKAIALAALAGLTAVILAACGGTIGVTEPTPTPELRADLMRTPVAATSIPVGTLSAGAANLMVGVGVQVAEGEKLEILLADAATGYRRFRPDEFTFKLGQKITVELTSQSEDHTFTFRDMPTEDGEIVDVQVAGGETVTVDFVPTVARTWKFVCTIHEINGMVGEIHVKE